MTEEKNNQTIKPLLFKTYISLIEKSIGSETYQTLYALKNGVEEDILESGNLSCAFFVSSILSMTHLIQSQHATVQGTVKDLEESGWYRIEEPRVGCVLVWEEKNGHTHIGFYMGDNVAISNDSEKKTPQKHHVTFGEENGRPYRNITSIWWKEGLEDM